MPPSQSVVNTTASATKPAVDQKKDSRGFLSGIFGN
jgi:hypothetical protein